MNTILLVDDEKTVLDSLKQQLRGALGGRFYIEVAESVPEAWEVIEELNDGSALLAVIVSDWQMPEVKGDEFLRQVKAIHPHIRRILLTGQADADAVLRAVGDDAIQQVLYKPWRLDELRAAITGPRG